jgi:hypothetical protein
VARCRPGRVAAALLDAAALAGRAPAWLQRLGRSVDASWTRVADLGKEQTALLDSIEAAVRLLVPSGWAVMHMDTEAVNAAVAAMRAGNPDEADDLLAMQWEDEGDWRIRRVGQRVRSMAAADEELNALFRERARLLDLAAEHHHEVSPGLLVGSLLPAATDSPASASRRTER